MVPKYILIFVLLLHMNNMAVTANDNPYIPAEIIKAIKVGNAGVLADYFNVNIELLILENEDVYSQAQAEQILKDFFIRNKPVGFTILHQSGKGESRYAIGTLTTEKEKYRVYFLIKMNNNIPLIHQLSIEKENAG